MRFQLHGDFGAKMGVIGVVPRTPNAPISLFSNQTHTQNLLPHTLLSSVCSSSRGRRFSLLSLRKGVSFVLACLPSSSSSSSSSSPKASSTKLHVGVNLVTDKIANRPRGFAFTHYATEAGKSQKSIEGMHGKEVTYTLDELLSVDGRLDNHGRLETSYSLRDICGINFEGQISIPKIHKFSKKEPQQHEV